MGTNRRKFRLALTSLMLVLLLSVFGGVSASAQGPGDWTEYPGNPIFGESVGGPRAYYPSVLYDADEFSGHGASAKYKMWYGTSGGQTGLATSDDGIAWTEHATEHGVVMTDGYHATVEYYPDGFSGVNSGDNPSSSIMYYRMWYWDCYTIYSVTAIGYTESPDGVNWYNHQPLQNGTVPIVTGVYPEWNRGSYGPSDILHNPSASNTGTDWIFTMYYDGSAGGDEKIGVGFSSDGITWTGHDAGNDGKADPVFEGSYVDGDWDETYVSRATIIKNADDDYEMWYSGGIGTMNHGIGYATSLDGIQWTRDANNLIFHVGDGIGWRDSRTYCPAVLKDGSSYKMWFAGVGSGGYSIGYATPPPEIVWVDDDWSGQSDVNVFDPALTWQYNAFNSLQDGIDAVPSGTASNRSIVHVLDGTYGSSGTGSSCEGFPAAIVIKDLDYLTIQAVPGHEPVVAPTTAGEVNVVSIAVQGSDHLIIDNIDSDQTIAQFDNWHFCSDDLIVRNSRFEGGEDGIDFSGSLTAALIENNEFIDINTGSGDEVLDFTDASYSDIVIQDNVFENNYRHITLNESGGSVIRNFVIRRNLMNGTNSEEAIRLIGASDVLVENNVIMNNLQQGVYIDSGCSNIRVCHNTFFNNDQESKGNGEVRTKVTSADIVIKNNIFYANGTNPVFETTVSSLPGEDYNLVYNYSGSFTFGANTITGLDPLFVSTAPGSEDLHLQAGSLAIEAGTDLGVSDDIEKSSRPNPAGTDPDIGAYEVGRPAPRVAKLIVVDNLQRLLPTGDKKTDHRIEEAIKHINKSLGPNLWETDLTLTKKGKEVFEEEKKAVHELMKIVRSGGPSAGDAQTAIDTLVSADETLAQNAIDEAIAVGGDPKEIAKAEEEMTKAQQELDHTKKDGTPDPRYDKAIDHYKKAWEHACKANKTIKTKTAAIEPFAITDELKVVAYPNPVRNVHTATFQVMGMLAAEVEEIRVQIFDLSGHLVWEDAAFGGELDWHTDSLSGDYLANGMYLYRVQVRIDGNWINQDIGRIAVLR